MGRASSSKKVARAARAGGTSSQSKNWLWPLAMVVVVALGVGLIVVSRGTGGDDIDEAAPQPGDHWHAAYGINVCGEWQPPLVDEEDRTGIHTHGDGLVHIHPFSSRFGGSNANLGAWADSIGLELGTDGFTMPDGTEWSADDGDDCDGDDAQVQLTVWSDAQAEEGEVVEGDPAEYAPQDGEVVALSFVPAGTEVGKPPTTARLADPLAAEEGRQPVPLDDVPDAPEGAITEGTQPEDDASVDAEGGTVPTDGDDTADGDGEGDATTTTAAP